MSGLRLYRIDRLILPYARGHLAIRRGQPKKEEPLADGHEELKLGLGRPLFLSPGTSVRIDAVGPLML